MTPKLSRLGNTGPFDAGSFSKSAAKKRPQRKGGRALGSSCSAVLDNREGGVEASSA
jgi:hypothetical protein